MIFINGAGQRYCAYFWSWWRINHPTHLCASTDENYFNSKSSTTIFLEYPSKQVILLFVSIHFSDGYHALRLRWHYALVSPTVALLRLLNWSQDQMIHDDFKIFFLKILSNHFSVQKCAKSKPWMEHLDSKFIARRSCLLHDCLRYFYADTLRPTTYNSCIIVASECRNPYYIGMVYMKSSFLR